MQSEGSSLPNQWSDITQWQTWIDGRTKLTLSFGIFTVVNMIDGRTKHLLSFGILTSTVRSLESGSDSWETFIWAPVRSLISLILAPCYWQELLNPLFKRSRFDSDQGSGCLHYLQPACQWWSHTAGRARPAEEPKVEGCWAPTGLGQTPITFWDDKLVSWLISQVHNNLQAREKALKMVSTLPEKVITLSWAPGSEQDIPAPVWKRNISGTFLQHIFSVWANLLSQLL